MNTARTALIYLLLATAVAGRMVAHLGSAIVGFPGIDALDTVLLRGLIPGALGSGGASTGVFFPTGFPVLGLAPNLLDHLSAAPLVAALPFPLADNLWWLVALWCNGLAGHRLGRVAGGSQGAGWLVGVGWLLSEPVLREANLHHAPQILVFWAPLYLAELLLLRREPSLGRALRAGLLYALAALSYWYYGLFLALGSLPLLLTRGETGRIPWHRLLQMGAAAGLTLAPLLAPMLLRWGQDPITAGGQVPPPFHPPASYERVPEALRFSAQHGADLLFWLRRTPMDTSNRLSLALILAAAIGARMSDRGTRRALLAMSGLGAVMLLGPYLRWGDEIWLLGDQAISLPFRWLGQLHPALARLTWPERWGMLVPLGLLPLAARIANPGRWAALIALESLLLSANLPLQRIDLGGQACWSALSGASGAVLELPMSRQGLLAPRVGVHRRYHRRPVVNQMLLPPGTPPPQVWRDWVAGQPLLGFLASFEGGAWPADPGADAVRSLRAAGVSVIAVDAEPGAVLTEGGLTRYRTGLTRALGPPIDLGCALVWWLDEAAPPPTGVDGAAWRARLTRERERHPAQKLPTLMAPEGPGSNASND